MALKTQTPFWSTNVREGFLVALLLTIVLAIGFVLGLNVPR